MLPNGIRAGTCLLALAASVSFLRADDADPKAKPEPGVPAKPLNESMVRAALDREIDADLDGQTVKDVCRLLGDRYGLAVRIDTAAYKRLGGAGSEGLAADAPANAVRALYETKLDVPVSRGMTVADAVTEVCTQLPGKWAYRVRHNAVLIAPAFQPPAAPGSGQPGDSPAALVPAAQMAEQLLGESVTYKADAVPLAQVVAELQKKTGANVVLDVRAADVAKAKVTGTFNDARLLTVLQTLTDMAGLKVVGRNNVFYVTSPENADRIQDEANRELFGEPAPALPPPAPRE